MSCWSVELTPGNTDDRKPVRQLTEGLFGKLFGDKGYISQEWVDELFAEGIQLVTSIRKGMKNKFMSVSEKLLLKKRMLIESVIDRLKNGCQLEHSRHRSVPNFFVHVASTEKRSTACGSHTDSPASIALYRRQKLYLASTSSLNAASES